MNEQVLTMTTSACSASGMTVMPAWCRWPTMISESTRFLAQPREMRLTLIMRGNERPRAGSGRMPWPEDRVGSRGGSLLLLRGGLGALLLALEIGGPAFAFDVLVQLLTHGVRWKERADVSERPGRVKRRGRSVGVLHFSFSECLFPLPAGRRGRYGGATLPMPESASLPVLAADVVVVGGGMAGVMAALAAKTPECRVLLVEPSNVLGGQGTAGGVAGFCGDTARVNRPFAELVRRLGRHGLIEPYRPNDDRRAYDLEWCAFFPAGDGRGGGGRRVAPHARDRRAGRRRSVTELTLAPRRRRAHACSRVS
jgi:hypothetical protein